MNRRDRQTLLQSRKPEDERLRNLDAVAPIRTLGDWFTNTKHMMNLSEAVDSHFVW